MKLLYKQTAGYQRRISRTTFVKETFKKMRQFFLRKNTLSSSYFLIVPKLKSFWLFAEQNLIIEAESTFWRNNSIWYACYSNFPAFGDFKAFQVVAKRTLYFFKKDPSFERYWRILSFQEHLTPTLLQLFQSVFSRSVAWTYLPTWRERNWQTSG